MEIEPKLKLHCQLLGRDSVITGNVSINAREIAADLYSYGGYITCLDSDFVAVRCENLSLITFTNYWDHGPGCTSSYGGSVWHKRIEASTAIIGQHEWLPDYKISSVKFVLNDPSQFLVPTEHETLIFANEVANIPTLFSNGSHEFGGDIVASIIDHRNNDVLHAVGDRITAKVSSFSRRAFVGNGEIGGSVEIVFNNPQILRDYMDEVTNFTSLLALSQGFPLRPLNLRIGSLDAPKDRTICGQEHDSSFEVRYVWGEELKEISVSKAIQKSIFNARTAKDRAEFQEAATSWLQRDKSWSRAHHLAAAQTSHGNTFGRDRLFAAFAWLESIPSDRPPKIASKEKLKLIQIAAEKKAKEIGVIAARPAIQEALKNINAESKRQRLIRYAKDLSSIGIDRSEMSYFLVDCLQAWSLRSKLIHGSAMDGEYDFPESVNFIQAVELLAAFFTLRGLGLDDITILSRLRQHELGKYISLFRGARRPI